MGFRNPVQREGLHGHPHRHDDAGQILRFLRWRQLEQRAMRIHDPNRTASAYRGQWNGVRVERANGEDAHRQSERHHPMCEHGSRGQQSGLRRLALLSDLMRIVFRNPAMEASVYERQPHSVSSRAHRHDQRQRQVHRQRTAELLDGE